MKKVLYLTNEHEIEINMPDELFKEFIKYEKVLRMKVSKHKIGGHKVGEIIIDEFKTRQPK